MFSFFSFSVEHNERKDSSAVNSYRLQFRIFSVLFFLTARERAPKIDPLLDDHLSPGMSAERGGWTGGSVSASLTNRFPVCDLRNEFERVALDLSSTSEDTADSGFGCLTASGAEGLDGNSLGAWDWTEREEDDSSSEAYHTADEDADSSGGPCTPARGILCYTSPRSCEEDDLSVSSCSSYKSTHSTPEHPEEFQPQVFLTG